MKLISKLVILSTILAIGSNLRFKRRAGYRAIQKLECSANPAVARVYCNIKPLNRTTKRILWSIDLLQPTYDMSIRAKQWRKMASNRWMPGFYDLKIDFCDTTKNYENLPATNLAKIFIDNYVPHWKQLLHNKSVFHACPYQGNFTHVFYHTYGPTFGALQMLPYADYKADVMFYNDENELFNLTFYESTK